MKNLFIYHEGTGTVIPLSDKVFLCDVDAIDPVEYQDMLNGASVDVIFHKGYRLDNYNMTNLFFGGAE
jgi:hypothetical protein